MFRKNIAGKKFALERGRIFQNEEGGAGTGKRSPSFRGDNGWKIPQKE